MGRLFSLGLAAVILSETVGPAKITGGILIVAGVYAGSFGKKESSGGPAEG